MVRGPPAEESAHFLGQQRLGQGHHDQGNRRHAHEQQQQLLEDNPRAEFFLAGEEKLHRRPMHRLMTEHVDQVDQHGYPDKP